MGSPKNNFMLSCVDPYRMAALLVVNSLLFALLAPCHAGASTPENVNLFLGEPYASQLQATFARSQIPKASK
jgi:hypothetical protein